MPRPARETLSRSRVLRAGIALADAEGLEAVTMRRLAQSLGVVPMALYKHVADKEDLLDGMVGALIDDMWVPESSGRGESAPEDSARAGLALRVPARESPARVGLALEIPVCEDSARESPALGRNDEHPAAQWQAAVREALRGARRVVIAHAWARRAIESRTQRTPAVLAHMERMSQIFLQAGFTPDLTHHVMHLLGNRMWGFSPELFAEPPVAAIEAAGVTSAEASAGRAGVETAELLPAELPVGESPARTARAAATSSRRASAPPPDPADYPGIVAIAADARARRPRAVGCDEDFEYDFALEVILEGVARLYQAGWSSPA